MQRIDFPLWLSIWQATGHIKLCRCVLEMVVECRCLCASTLMDKFDDYNRVACMYKKSMPLGMRPPFVLCLSSFHITSRAAVSPNLYQIYNVFSHTRHNFASQTLLATYHIFQHLSGNSDTAQQQRQQKKRKYNALSC